MKIVRRISKLNKQLAVGATRALGTMWCVYLFTALTVAPILLPKTGPVIQYISSAMLQLIFLPLIMVGSNVLDEKSERRSARDHELLQQQQDALAIIIDRLNSMPHNLPCKARTEETH